MDNKPDNVIPMFPFDPLTREPTGFVILSGFKLPRDVFRKVEAEHRLTGESYTAIMRQFIEIGLFLREEKRKGAQIVVGGQAITFL